MHNFDKKAFSAAIEAMAGEFPPESGITYDVLQRLCAAYHEAAKAPVSDEPAAFTKARAEMLEGWEKADQPGELTHDLYHALSWLYEVARVSDAHYAAVTHAAATMKRYESAKAQETGGAPDEPIPEGQKWQQPWYDYWAATESSGSNKTDWKNAFHAGWLAREYQIGKLRDSLNMANRLLEKHKPPKRESGRESQQIEMLHGDARRKQQMKGLVEENRMLREALHPHAGIKDTYPLILYFDSKTDANEFVALVQEAKPGMKSYQLDD